MIDDDEHAPINEDEHEQNDDDMAAKEEDCIPGLEPGQLAEPLTEKFSLRDKKNGIELEVWSCGYKADFLAKLCLKVRQELLKNSHDKNGGLGYI
jgi:hypothetical protein